MMHEALTPLAGLLGTWEGVSLGLWNPDAPIAFRETVTYDHVGKPYLRYRQQTWREDGLASHGELGYLIPEGGVRWQLILAQPSAITEIDAGILTGGRLELRSLTIGRAPGAKNVTAVARMIEFGVSDLRYELWIGMNDQAPAQHIRGDLRRVEPLQPEVTTDST